MAYVAHGWAMLAASKVAHYFVRGGSLCGKWTTRSMLPAFPLAARRCVFCERELSHHSPRWSVSNVLQRT